MAASLTITPVSYNGTFAYAADGSAFEMSGSFNVDNAKIVSLAGEISGVGEFTGSYAAAAEGLVYTLKPADLANADDLADAIAEVAEAISENFWPTEQPADDNADAPDGGDTDGDV